MVEHVADLGWEKQKIKTLADLKQEIIKEMKIYTVDLISYAIVQEKFAKFEAGVRERMELNESLVKELGIHGGIATIRNKELRAILGEGEGL